MVHPDRLVMREGAERFGGRVVHAGDDRLDALLDRLPYLLSGATWAAVGASYSPAKLVDTPPGLINTYLVRLAWWRVAQATPRRSFAFPACIWAVTP
jgi:hypothetical protein